WWRLSVPDMMPHEFVVRMVHAAGRCGGCGLQECVAPAGRNVFEAVLAVGVAQGRVLLATADDERHPGAWQHRVRAAENAVAVVVVPDHALEYRAGSDCRRGPGGPGTGSLHAVADHYGRVVLCGYLDE